MTTLTLNNDLICDTCGRWDSALIDGMCNECRTRYNVAPNKQENTVPYFSNKSRRKLATVHHVLQDLCNRVIEHYNITILVGHRPQKEQDAAYNSGASTKLWPDSNHNHYPSKAVDAAPWPIPEGWGDLDGQTPKARDLDWKERVKFYEMISVFRFAWSQLCNDFPEIGERYRIRFGADWDGDNDYRDQTFDDLPHIELIEVSYG